MSSLRLALKQSLQETGHLAPTKEKKKKKKVSSTTNKQSSATAAAATTTSTKPSSSGNTTPRPRGRQRQLGEPPKRRGRPPKQQSTADESSPTSEPTSKEATKHEDEDDETGHYSSENEFSYDSEMSHDDEEEEEEDDDEDDDDEEEEAGEENEEDDDEGQVRGGSSRGEDDQGDEMRNIQQKKANRAEGRNSNEEVSVSDEERRKQRKLIKKQLKHSAANKIQSQWKKSKKITDDNDDNDTREDSHENTELGSNPMAEDSAVADKNAKNNSPSSANANPANLGKKNKRKAGTVPAPLPEVLEWFRSLSDKKCRKNIAKGMRVKVRFATKVKRDGKVVKKKIWYGGRVSAASKEGSKIKIKYDDGTSEISKFPDKDVVVDDTDNGQHLSTIQSAANKFKPPSMREEESAHAIDDEDQTLEDASAEATESQSMSEEPKTDQAEPPSSSNNAKSIEKETKLTNNDGDDAVNEAEATKVKDGSTTEETGVEAESTQRRKGDDKNLMEDESRSGTDGVESALSEQIAKGETEDTNVEMLTGEEKKEPLANSESIDQGDSAKDGSSTERTEDLKGENKEPPKRSLTIRISNMNTPEDRGITPMKNQTSIVETPDYSSEEEELHADTPVTERKVKSIKVKRKRASNDGSPDAPLVKKQRSENKSSPSHDEEMEESEGKAKIQQEESSPSEEGPELVSVPTLGGKTKKKKDRSNSPVPKGRRSPVRSPVKGESPQLMSEDLDRSLKGESDIGKSGASKEVVFDSTEGEGGSETAVGGSKGKPKNADENEVIQEGVALVKSKDSSKGSTDSLPRAGRKAAQEAKVKLNSKQDPSVQESGKKKKKRRRKEGSDGEDSDEDDRQWVQCDKCKKWRILPSRVKSASLPDEWYCNLNVYDPKHNDCSAPEQTVKQVAKEWRRARKRVKQQRLEQAALEADQKDSLNKADSAAGKDLASKPSANSPKPPKLAVASRKVGENDSKRSSPTNSESNAPPSESGSEPPVKVGEKKRGRKPKSKPVETQSQTQDSQADSAPKDSTTETTPKKPGRKRGRPARSQNSIEAARRGALDKKDDDNVEWVQCEKCEKWRKLPPYMAADELPDTWFCTMNTWNPDSASCEAPEDKADAHHQEVGAFGNFAQGHAGKYSYRSMIFGNGRKQNRPMSEKARAAESLFMRPIDDEENAHPSCMYSKSSMFLPRTSNFNRPPSVDNKGVSILDALSDSELWTELRGVGQPMHIYSDGLGNSYPRVTTFETLPESMKETMREVVLQALGLGVLSGDEIIQEAHYFPWESLPNGLSQIRAYINPDVIINTLLGLVRDGVVEMTCFKDPSVPVSEWVPRYRRVIRTRRQVEAEETLKESKCMKISKPWKRPDNSESEWVTGGDMTA